MNDFLLSPDFRESVLAESRARFFRGGDVTDPRLSNYCKRLAERFRLFVSACPAPFWAPGLHLAQEIRLQYEMYLPMEEIVPALAYLCRRSNLDETMPLGRSFFTSLSWPDFLQLALPFPVPVNPAEFLSRSAVCENYRLGLLAALAIPRSYGGSFGRYPLQLAFLRSWLAENRYRLAGGVAVLDAACGCGEGCYEVAGLLDELEYSKSSSMICGATLEPLELMAAAHGSFPNDAVRTREFIARVGPIVGSGGSGMIRFCRADILDPGDMEGEFDVIMCNGFLGGPLLHRKELVGRAIETLVKKLAVGGVLVASDRFHAGWRKKMQGEVVSLLERYGLEIVDIGEGVAGVRRGPGALPRRALRQIP